MTNSKVKCALPSKSEFGLNSAALLKGNKNIIAYVRKVVFKRTKRIQDTRVARDAEKKNPYALLLETEIRIIVMESTMQVLQNLNLELLYD